MDELGYIDTRKMVIIFTILLIAVTGAAGYFYFQYQRSIQSGTYADAQVITQVGKHMLLPASEQPTIATVTDSTKLRSEPFFAQAVDGDKLLIYAHAKEVILYRPSIDKIVEASFNTSITADATATTTTTSSPTPTQQSQTLSIAIYNGSGVTGLAAKAEQNITSKITNISVSTKQNAKFLYNTSLVIDISGQHAQAAQQLATFLGTTVTTLPAGETAPQADLLVIIGKDYASK